MVPLNNDETIRIQNMFPMCQCRKGTGRSSHRLVAHRWGLGDVRQCEIESVSPYLIDSLHVQLHTISSGFEAGSVDRAIPSLPPKGVS